MKVIDLLNKIANGEVIPKKIKVNDNAYHYDIDDCDYYADNGKATLEENIYLHNAYIWLNLEVEDLDNEEVKPLTKKDLETLGYACGEIKKCIEKGFNKSLDNEPLEDDDKDIPLIPDDELYVFKGDSRELNYNFKVLQEKINQVVKEFNEYRKENE